MNIDNLQIGQEIKNYKVLCELLEEPIKNGGKSKDYQLKDFERYFSFHKQGQKFIIDEVFDEPLAKEDGRSLGNNIKDYEQLKIPYGKRNNIGIYFIIKDNDLYIGSTIKGFRKRFQKHYYGCDENMIHTYDLLHNGGEFHLLYDMTGINDEPLVRMVEDEYINYFINFTNYNVINRMEKAWSLTENNKIKYKTIKIKIEEKDYNDTLKFLIDNGLISSVQ